MNIRMMAKIIQAEAAKGKDVEQLALGYLEEVLESAAIICADQISRDRVRMLKDRG